MNQHLQQLQNHSITNFYMMPPRYTPPVRGVFAQPTAPVLKGYTDIVNSLDAIQKTWDENETNKTLRKYNTPADSESSLPATATDSVLPDATLGRLELGMFESLCSKYTQSRASADSSSSCDTICTPQTEEGEEEEEEVGGEEDEIVAKIVANLQAKIRAVRKRKRLAAEVESMRKELAAKEIELKECDRVMALEMGQVSPDRSDSNTNTISSQQA